MKILFLDIDGVLKPLPASDRNAHSFSKEAVINLEYLLNKEKDLKIVISSTWRKMGLEKIKEILKENGVDPRRVIDITGDEQSTDEKDHRGYQVECWLKRHPEIKHFAILDDHTDFVPLRHKLVKTTGHIGLTQENVERLMELLSE